MRSTRDWGVAVVELGRVMRVERMCGLVARRRVLPLSRTLQPPGARFGRVFVAMDMGWRIVGFGDVRMPKLFRARLSRLKILRLEHQESRLVRQGQFQHVRIEPVQRNQTPFFVAIILENKSISSSTSRSTALFLPFLYHAHTSLKRTNHQT
jgi:hypothetical protein